MNRASLIVAAIVGTLAMVFASASCNNSHTDPSASDSSASLTLPLVDMQALTFIENPEVHLEDGGEVKVTTAAAWKDENTLVIRANYAPVEEGYHVYSNTLPREGIEGFGRPTILELAPSAPRKAIAKTGPAVPDQPTHELKQEWADFGMPVFPDGPVNLYLPLQLNSNAKLGQTLPISVTYMACSYDLCKRPFENVEIPVPLPARPES